MLNKTINTLTEYCTGCGLCSSVNTVKFSEDDKGFIYPKLCNHDLELCKIICPASGYALNNFSDRSIFGVVKKSFLGWSTDEHIRFTSSSGGVLTSICIFLIENKIVDGIIQTRKSEQDPRLAETIVTRNRDEILSCMGSRYTTSSPLMDIISKIKPNKKYAFVGKPCDVSALRMYKETRKEEWTNQILYLFSFFCAGQPSLAANNKLLSSLGCYNINDCLDLQYRGNGWPGYAKVTKKDMSMSTMGYEESWMAILGRDVRKCCRFCADGTGEYADISLGDAWYLTDDNKPDLNEHLGRNVILCRTEKGLELLNHVSNFLSIMTEPFDIDKDKLAKRQPYHYARKASLSSLKIAMMVCGRNFPMYSNKILSAFAKDFSLKSKIYRCLGTIHRVWKKII